MSSLIIVLTCAAVFMAGLIGITLSVPLQAPAVVLFGLAAILAAIQALKSGSPEVLESHVEGHKSKSSTRLLWVVAIAIGYFVVRACLSPVWDLGVEDLMLILSAGILYLIAGYAVTGKSGILLRQGLAWVMVVLLLLHVGAAVMQLNGGEGYSAAYYFTGAGRSSPENVTGMYSYYGSFANFAVIAGLLCLSLAVWGRLSVMLRVMMCLLGVVALALALWSQSRSAVISLFPAIIVFGVILAVSVKEQNHKVKQRFRVSLLVLGLAGLGVGIAGGITVLQARAGNSEGVETLFASPARLLYWPMAVEQWADYPIVGAGSRSFSYESFCYWNPNMLTTAANPEFVHNEYLQLLTDYGLVGLLLILVLFGWHFYRGGEQVRSLAVKIGKGGLKRGSNAMALAIAGISGMTAMAVHICFDFRTHLLANLLLLICCAVWILPVAKSAALKLKKDNIKTTDGRKQKVCLALVLFCLGLGAIGLGGQQLWAGLPLIKNMMAKEDGAWQPATVNRDVWIPALEESLARAPQWRRYQRLGTLYQIEASNLVENEQENAIAKAKAAYLVSIERHSHNPIPWINLASIYSEEGQFEKADKAYENATERAKAREWWFRMHSQWAAMQQQWAMHEWKLKKWDDAENHFLRAEELCVQSRDIASLSRDKKWVVQYTKLLIIHARFLDTQHKFDEAQKLFAKARVLPNWYWWGRDTKSHYIWSLHTYDHGRHLWYQRKPEEALQLMKQAKKHLQTYHRLLKDDVDKPWHDHMKKVQEVIDFLENSGIGK